MKESRPRIVGGRRVLRAGAASGAAHGSPGMRVAVSCRCRKLKFHTDVGCSTEIASRSTQREQALPRMERGRGERAFELGLAPAGGESRLDGVAPGRICRPERAVEKSWTGRQPALTWRSAVARLLAGYAVAAQLLGGSQTLGQGRRELVVVVTPAAQHGRMTRNVIALAVRAEGLFLTCHTRLVLCRSFTQTRGQVRLSVTLAPAIIRQLG